MTSGLFPCRPTHPTPHDLAVKPKALDYHAPSMSQTAVLVWLSASAISPGFRADLDGFAQSRLLRLEAPRENAASFAAPAYAPDVVAQIEVLLEEARNATASLE